MSSQYGREGGGGGGTQALVEWLRVSRRGRGGARGTPRVEERNVEAVGAELRRVRLVRGEGRGVSD